MTPAPEIQVTASADELWPQEMVCFDAVEMTGMSGTCEWRVVGDDDGFKLGTPSCEQFCVRQTQAGMSCDRVVRVEVEGTVGPCCDFYQAEARFIDKENPESPDRTSCGWTASW